MKTLKVFIGFFLAMLVGCVMLLGAALAGSEKATYGIVGLLVLISLLFLSSTNIFAQEK